MGARGPVPKRSSQRRRRNVTEPPTTAPAAPAVDVPAPGDWYPPVVAWYEALAESGQSMFYEPSDWATAWLLAESMSRDLSPRQVGATEDGEPIMVEFPLKGTALAAYLQGMATLLVTEGDRRRVKLELERAKAPAAAPAAPGVTELDEYRRRLSG